MRLRRDARQDVQFEKSRGCICGVEKSPREPFQESWGGDHSVTISETGGGRVPSSQPRRRGRRIVQ